jgi:hypothetical protein
MESTPQHSANQFDVKRKEVLRKIRRVARKVQQQVDKVLADKPRVEKQPREKPAN